MTEYTNEGAINLTESALEANDALQERLEKYILDLESEQEGLDRLINNLSKAESSLPEERADDEVIVETAPYGANYETLRHALTPKQISSETSPFYQAVMQRRRYELLTTTRPFTREEQRLLHVSVVIENKRLHALRARERGEDPFAAVQSLPDSFFDKYDPEISWSSVAQNMASNPPRTGDQCRIMYVSTELPSINRSDWTPEELESLETIVEAHNRSSAEPVEDIEKNRDMLRVDWVEIAQELGTNRTALQCLRRFVLEPSNAHGGPTKSRKRPAITTQPAKGKAVHASEKSTGQVWTKAEDKLLLEGVQRHGMGSWPEVALHLNSAMSGTSGHIARTPNQCSFRYTKSLCPTIKKGKWSAEEDEALRKGVAAFGRTWIKVQEYVEGRTDAQCRERWSNMLDPSLKTGPWEAEEDRILLDAVDRKLPWSAVSALLPGRTDNRCAKRYQILIKEQEPGQASAVTPGTKKSQKRAKKQKENAVHEGNEVDPGVANPVGQATPSAGVTPESAAITNEIPVPEVSVGVKLKPRRKPKVKARAEEQSLTEPVESSGRDAAPGTVETSEQGGDALSGDADRATSIENPSEPSGPNKKNPKAKQVPTPCEGEGSAHTGITLRRSSRVANKK